MNIKRLECDQFAGLLDKSMDFEKGLNIVVGENESGKSTMVDLIYQLLFKDVKLSGRSDTDFIDKYFPKKAGGYQGDVVDGVLVFETPSGTFKLRKEWEKGEGVCRLTLPDGTSVKSIEVISEILGKELKHRAGVYSEIVFASQKSDSKAVESIMSALKKKGDSLWETRTELTSTLTRAALETGGVSIEKIEKNIQTNMDSLIGRWDWEADAPEGGPKRASYKNAWVNGAGAIVKAYYEADKIRSMQIDAENAEREAEAEKEIIQRLRAEKKSAEAERTAFQKYRGLIGQISLLENSIKTIEEKIIEQNKALSVWPEIKDSIAKAKELQEKLRQAQIRELYLKTEPVYRSYQKKTEELTNMKEVDDLDLKRLRELVICKQKEETKLTGINLAAKIREFGSAEVLITSIATGEVLNPSEGEVRITEAVNISIPGIADIQLMPEGVEIEKVEEKLRTLEGEIKALYEKYEVHSLEELENKSEAFASAKQESDRLALELEKNLKGMDRETLKEMNAGVPEDIESEMEIESQISILCGCKTIDGFIGGMESTLDGYENRYGSVEKLKASVKKLNEDKETSRRKLDSMDEIPEKYHGIEDPDRFDDTLLEKIEDYDARIEIHSSKLSEAERNLGDKSSEEYTEELQDKEAVLKARKTEYEHWNNIYRVFRRLMERNDENPVDDIEEKFREYLQLISEGTLQLRSMDEKMSVQLTSGTHALTYGILSEGTKDTVSLAFRLAMLEHLYPDGDGLAVFDDPFADMDAKRVEQSCKLIQKFAEKNQIIFVTCDRKYEEYMCGNVIHINR